MKIGILSDTHNRLDQIDKILRFFENEGVETLIHAGDLEHTEILEHIAKKFHGQIYCAQGNADIAPDELYKLSDIYPNLSYAPEQRNLTLGGLRVAVTHKPDAAERIAQEDPHDLIIYGHTHKPWQSRTNGCELLNPGNSADIGFPATCAIYDTQTRAPRLVQIALLK